jgi:hypothetical protein
MQGNCAPKDGRITKCDDYRWGWIVWYGDSDGELILGAGPLIISNVTGELIATGSMVDLESEIKKQERIAGLRPWWRFW